MFSHFTLGSNDMARSRRFYDAVMPPLGIGAIATAVHPDFSGYGPGGERVSPWVSLCRPFDGGAASPGNGFHIAFAAPDEAAVRAFHAAALANGGSDEGAPGLRPQYSEDYFGAYVRDPDGNKLQALHHGKGRSFGPGGDVISHITAPFDDPDAGLAFYGPVLAVLGIARDAAMETPGEDYAFTKDGAVKPCVFVQKPFNGAPARPGNGQHAAFAAKNRAHVDEFYETAVRLGAACEGPPGVRADYGADYYAAYVRDPAGLKIQAVRRD
ncbi:MAG: VOC family protein [Rhodospirillales bacterium]